MIRASVTTIATSHADDAAYLALHDVSRLTVGFDDVRVVGGQMASLLLHAYPVPGAAHRRTADADTAISTQIAASGEMHTRLLAAGYAAETGNHYVMPGIDEEDRHIDLLVPASGSAFTSEVVGDRGFDAAPGLGLALAAPPILIDVDVTLTSGILLEFSARVPPVELALVLKAYATQSRHATRDYVDLYNLLSIAYEYRDSPEAIGGWKIGRATTTGARRDAASILNGIADRSRAVSELDDTAISRERFVAMVRSLIPNPSQAP